MKLVKTFTVSFTVDLTCHDQVQEAIEFLKKHGQYYRVDLQSWPMDKSGSGKIALIKVLRRYLTLMGKVSSIKTAKFLAEEILEEIEYGLCWLRVIEVMKTRGDLNKNTKDVFVECIEVEAYQNMHSKTSILRSKSKDS